MKHLIIADSHVGTRDGDVEAMVDLLIRAEDVGVREVIYLGDTFQYLIGMSKFWTEGVSRILEAWDGFRTRGGEVRLIEGNRDFFLDEPDLACRIDQSAVSLEFAAGPTTFRLVHGDKVNQRDLQYLFWSRLSKCLPARLWARWLPRRVAVTIVRKMEAHLAKTNRKFRYEKPVEALRAEALRVFSQGVDVQLFGHFHSLWTFSEGGKTAMVVPAWLETGQSLIIESSGRWYGVNQDLQPDEFEAGEVAGD
jgi:UDP-2,3-diacylglucosamine pyrophosphatase LpxH